MLSSESTELPGGASSTVTGVAENVAGSGGTENVLGGAGTEASSCCCGGS